LVLGAVILNEGGLYPRIQLLIALLLREVKALLLLLTDDVLELLGYLRLARIGEMQSFNSLNPCGLLGPCLLSRHVSNLDDILVLRVAIATLRAILFWVSEVVPSATAACSVCGSVIVIALVATDSREMVNALCIHPIRLLGVAVRHTCGIVVRERLSLFMLALGGVDAYR